MESSILKTDGIFVIINNIPKDYHASDLRNFFSTFVETGAFICFHYRHRPEVQKPINESANTQEKELSRRVTNCCIVKVNSDRVKEFIQKYDNEHWLDRKGETLPSCCHTKQIAVSQDNSFSCSSSSYKKGMIGENLPLDLETFSDSHIESLIEMHPPSFMPNGNVGTKTSHFLTEINACRLPPSLIAKLGLQFPRSHRKRIYGSVPFDYIYKPKYRNIRNYKSKPAEPVVSEPSTHKKPWCPRFKPEETNLEEEEDKESQEESEEEEWDRVEALNDDVSGQERNKERLFEDKIELKWEKGGSGLVFYTDAQYWDKKDGDFDEKTADDWDVDMRVYEGSGMDCDKDMRDLVRMKLEKRIRDGTETEVDRLYDFAAFEKYSKGFGRKILESQGWKQGQGVGRDAAGISEPISNDGQRPFDKKGFGYRGEKLTSRPRTKRSRRQKIEEEADDSVYISTIYDNPKESDPPESVFTSSSFAKLKYRQEFLKEHS
ncbi:hypothetical protein JTE90_011744 [Oedothorax gibbosus]|uniref:G-patch domain-containing protein n=1 Tax=Oedothorax gibbosus TaxID=931172 RepID=A0AAV6U0F6_9ARAC|nr:hypothetical protein JTE90_011744 [Oedothorax gibbosus]